MIWVDGRVVPDDALKISVLDRTFEHGLGLFETLRTWNRHAPLLDRHLKRMRSSAYALGLPIDSVRLPDDESVANLLDAEGGDDDVMLRITLSGGLTETAGATLWMRAAPLPPPVRATGAIVDFASNPLRLNEFARHKSLNYWERRIAYESARKFHFDEVLLGGDLYDNLRVFEGSRTNVFLVEDDVLATPAAEFGYVPGVFRGLVLELVRELPLRVREVPSLSRSDFSGAQEVFLTNSVRGVIPVAKFRDWSWPAPGEWTRRVDMFVTEWLLRH